MSDYIIRRANPEDAAILTELAKKSKSYWGYDQSLILKWEEDLTITPDFIMNSTAFVAENNEKIIGFWCRSDINSNDITPGYLFIDPEYIGLGCGSALYKAVRKDLCAKGIKSFTLEADPNAEGFYLKLGGIKIGEKESPVVPGRFLPIIKFNLS